MLGQIVMGTVPDVSVLGLSSTSPGSRPRHRKAPATGPLCVELNHPSHASSRGSAAFDDMESEVSGCRMCHSLHSLCDEVRAAYLKACVRRGPWRRPSLGTPVLQVPRVPEHDKSTASGAADVEHA